MFETFNDIEVTLVAGGEPEVAPLAAYDNVYVPAAADTKTG